MSYRHLLASGSACLLLTAASADSPAFDAPARFQPIHHSPDRLVVQLRDGSVDGFSWTTQDDWETRPLARTTKADNASAKRLRGYYILDLADADPGDAEKRERLPRLRAALAARADVISVHYDYEVLAASPVREIAPLEHGTGGTAPNDPLFHGSGIWEHPVTQALGNQWALALIEAPSAWPIEHGDPDQPVTIAVLDTGIDFSLTDLAENMWTNESEQGNDEDQNGYVGDFMGWDFTTDQPSVLSSDLYGHGTHVAGVAAARGNNGVGMTGVIWNARIMNVKVLGDNGAGSLAQVAAGIVYAADNGADVINLSITTSGWLPAYSVPYLIEAIDHATGLGALVVAAAGNGGIEDIGNHEAGVMPSSAVNAMAVSSFDELDQLAGYSNFGPGISVAAPGVTSYTEGLTDWWQGVLSLRSSTMDNPLYAELLVGDDYLRLGGTSVAVPHVSGLGALIKSFLPSFRTALARFAIEDGSVDVGEPGQDLHSGFGRIDVDDGLLAAASLFDPVEPELVVNDIELPLEAEVSSDFEVRVRVQNLGDGEATGVPVRLYANQQPVGQALVDLAPGDMQELFLPVALGPAGPYEFEAAINDDFSLPEYRYSNNSLTSTMSIATQLLTTRALTDDTRFRDYVHACGGHILWSERLVDSPDRFEIFAFTWSEGEDISDPGVGVGPGAVSDNGENNLYPVCDAETIAWVKRTDSGDSIVTRRIDGGPLHEIALDGTTAWDLDLSGGDLVWREQDGSVATVRWAPLGADGVYMEGDDGPPVTLLTDVGYNVTAPKVEGGTLTWDLYDPDSGVFVIRRAQLASPGLYETLFEDVPLNSHKPNVSGDNVVWMTNEFLNGYYNRYFIYLKQGDNLPVALDAGQWTDTGDSYRCRIPQIDGHKVSWIRYLNKNAYAWGSRIMTYDLGPDGIYGTLDDAGLSQKTRLNDFHGRLGLSDGHVAAILFSADYVTSEVLALSDP